MNSTHRTTITIPVAERWFELRRLADDITFLTDPHVAPLLRCNISPRDKNDRTPLAHIRRGRAVLAAGFNTTVTR